LGESSNKIETIIDLLGKSLFHLVKVLKIRWCFSKMYHWYVYSLHSLNFKHKYILQNFYTSFIIFIVYVFIDEFPIFCQPTLLGH